jgi:hypothetical protein
MLNRTVSRGTPPPASWRPARRGVSALVLVTVTAAGVAATALVSANGQTVRGPATPAVTAAPAADSLQGRGSDAGNRAPAATAADPRSGSPLEAARARTAAVPQDGAGWAALALTALEAGRAGADPLLYAEARRAADRSLAVQPDDNDLGLAALAALANAEHDFAAARDHAERALAVNPLSPVALAALTDALTELGRADEGLRAARRLDAARPGVSSFTRLSYQAELRGRTAQARDLMVRAAQAAASPQQVAFARANEGLLALSAGDLAGAREALRAGRSVAPDDVTLAHLDARIAVSDDDIGRAVRLYAALVARRADPAFATEQAQVLAAAGDTRGRETALAVVRAGYALQASAGVRPEGAQVLFEADHGDPAAAVRLAREVYRRSPTSGHADALAWALHRAGDDTEALTRSDRALAPGARPAGFLYHRGAIRAALGDRTGAVADLRAALDGRPHFSPVDAPTARALLASLGATS